MLEENSIRIKMIRRYEISHASSILTAEAEPGELAKRRVRVRGVQKHSEPQHRSAIITASISGLNCAGETTLAPSRFKQIRHIATTFSVSSRAMTNTGSGFEFDIPRTQVR